MATQVLLTIDTELAWRHHASGAGWDDNFRFSYDPAGVGISYQLEILRRHGLKACFFLDPMPALVYGLEPIRRMVDPILEAGQELQLHVHTFWHDLARGTDEKPRFELTRFDAKEQADLIRMARDLLVEAGAPAPIAFRAGCYAANGDTLAALSPLDILYDSSHNGAEYPHLSALPFAPELVDPAARSGVVEIPISQIRRPDGGLRPLQICALSIREMRAALVHAATQRHRVTTIVSHSFELATRDGKRVNGLVRNRFDRLCAFLAEHQETMPTTSFGAIELDSDAPAAQPLATGRMRTAHRMAEQAWGTARYEKPAVGVALVALPPIVVFEELVALAGL